MVKAQVYSALIESPYKDYWMVHL